MTESENPQIPELPVEVLELELVLQIQEVVTGGSADALQDAVETAGYTFLFRMPDPDGDGAQQVAAISTGEGAARCILLVHLDPDGGVMSVEMPEAEANPVAEIAASYAGVMEHLGTFAAAA